MARGFRQSSTAWPDREILPFIRYSLFFIDVRSAVRWPAPERKCQYEQSARPAAGVSRKTYVSKDAACLFCHIAAGTEPAILVHEDELCISFMDIHPVGTGHVLVIPKQHAQKLQELGAPVQGHLFAVCNRIVAAQRRAGLGVDGTHILLNDGKATNQHVPHVHFHLIPRTGHDSASFFFRMVLHFTGLFGRRTPVPVLAAQAERIRRCLEPSPDAVEAAMPVCEMTSTA